MLIAKRFRHTHNVRYHINAMVRPGVDVDALIEAAEVQVPENFDGERTRIDIPADLTFDGRPGAIFVEAEELVTERIDSDQRDVMIMYAAERRYDNYEAVGGRFSPHDLGTEDALADAAACACAEWFIVRDVADADEIGGYRQEVLASGWYDAAHEGETPIEFAARLFAEARAAQEASS